MKLIAETGRGPQQQILAWVAPSNGTHTLNTHTN